MGKPGAKNAGTQLVFRTQKGKSIAPSNFSRSYRSLRDKLGITDLRLKSFRHGHATILDEVNAPLKVRQERMGHAELDMTMNTYTHTHDDQHRQVAVDINKVLTEVFVMQKDQAESPDKKAG